MTYLGLTTDSAFLHIKYAQVCAYLLTVACLECIVAEAFGKKARITVLLDAELAENFELFCKEHSHKKSTLAEHLIREFLRRENFPDQGRLL